MPIEICFCLAYTMGTIAGAIVVPGYLSLNEKGYGRAKGIPGTMIASGTFENITCLILFGICKQITFNKASKEIDG